MAADTTESLPRYLASLPRRIETVALRYVWVIVAIDLAGTAVGFRYYIPQFRLELRVREHLRDPHGVTHELYYKPDIHTARGIVADTAGESDPSAPARYVD